MYIWKTVLFFLLQFAINQLNGQTSFNIRFENSVESYFNNELGKQGIIVYGNDQILYEVGGKLDLSLDRWIHGVGVSYHERKINDLCVYWPTENDTFLQIAPGPIYRPELPCNRTVAGKKKYLETPIFIGYKFINNEKIAISGEIQWSPLIRINRYLSFDEIGSTDKLEINQNSSEIESWENHGVSINLLKRLNSKWDLITGLIFKSDDFSYKRIRLGITIGIEYQLIEF